MQTFILYHNSFVKSFLELDTKRHGKQRSESRHICDILTGIKPNSRYKNHPAVKMWKDWIPTLKIYHDLCIMTWIYKGYKNNMEFLFYKNFDVERITLYEMSLIDYLSMKPSWLTPSFCSAHRSNLLRKNYDFYAQYDWQEKHGDYKNIPYIWPI